jgi:peptidyl-tRNA hydrolase, PTH1 family
MWLIVGLGNPGAEYDGTRHNVGFEVVNVLAKRHGIPVQRRGFQSVLGDGRIGSQRVILARPMTYMNLSGAAVAAISRFYRLEPGNVIVVLDEVALPVGQLRLRYQGSAGGHNGLASVIQSVGTAAVPRVRIGVGAPDGAPLVGHVLSKFRPEEASIVREAYDRAADAIDCAVELGFETAMNRYNVRTDRPPANPAGGSGQPE